MKKSFVAFALMCVSSSAAAEPMQLTREERHVYATDDRSTVVVTDGCTQTADGMRARIVDGYRDGSRRFVEFRAADGSYENECEVKMVVRVSKPRIPVAAKKRQRRERTASR